MRAALSQLPQFEPALRHAATCQAVSLLLGDEGYDAEHNRRLRRGELGLSHSVIRTRLSKALCHSFRITRSRSPAVSGREGR